MRFNQNYFEIIQNRALFPGASPRGSKMITLLFFKKSNFLRKVLEEVLEKCSLNNY